MLQFRQFGRFNETPEVFWEFNFLTEVSHAINDFLTEVSHAINEIKYKGDRKKRKINTIQENGIICNERYDNLWWHWKCSHVNDVMY